jgi:ubiquitin carboxyl-terminal hydrolase L5
VSALPLSQISDRPSRRLLPLTRPLRARHRRPVYGLIFLFKYRSGEAPSAPVETDASSSGVFFASQVITNACATQAILSILMNCPPSVQLGEELGNMKAFTAEFDADLKGLAISNSEAIRKAHNSFARPEPIMEEQRDQAPSDDVFHFIAYMPVNGRLYELDGLKRGPIAHGECTDDDWLGKVCPVIQSRIEQYASSEIRFNLMALIKSPKQALEERLAKIEARKERCAKVAAGAAVDTGMDVDGGDDLDGPLPSGQDAVAAELARLEGEAAVAREGIEREAQKAQRWRDENIRRKHNYIPFIFNFLKVLAEKKKLEPLIAKARGQ